MGAVGFEPTKAEPSDLQSDPFVHFGTRPTLMGNVGRIVSPGWEKFQPGDACGPARHLPAHPFWSHRRAPRRARLVGPAEIHLEIGGARAHRVHRDVVR